MEQTETAEDRAIKKPQKPRYFVGFTPDGEVLYRIQPDGENYAPDPLRTAELGPEFDTNNPRHHQTMARFYAFLKILKSEHPSRAVPVTRKELFANGIDKPSYKELVKRGLLEERLIALTNTKKKTNMGSRAVVYFTIQGRAFIRKYFDPNYAVTENV